MSRAASQAVRSGSEGGRPAISTGSWAALRLSSHRTAMLPESRHWAKISRRFAAKGSYDGNGTSGAGRTESGLIAVSSGMIRTGRATLGGIGRQDRPQLGQDLGERAGIGSRKPVTDHRTAGRKAESSGSRWTVARAARGYMSQIARGLRLPHGWLIPKSIKGERSHDPASITPGSIGAFSFTEEERGRKQVISWSIVNKGRTPAGGRVRLRRTAPVPAPRRPGATPPHRGYAA
jgi:hypothetical protein